MTDERKEWLADPETSAFVESLRTRKRGTIGRLLAAAKESQDPKIQGLAREYMVITGLLEELQDEFK